jgi:hypothetical protein
MQVYFENGRNMLAMCQKLRNEADDACVHWLAFIQAIGRLQYDHARSESTQPGSEVGEGAGDTAPAPKLPAGG